MVERTLVDEIISIIHSEANNNPLPVKCTIHETYPNGLIDVLLENGNILNYLPVIGSPRVGDTGVLLYLDDEKNNQIIITNGGSSTDTGWQNVSFVAGYTNYPNDSLKIRRIGNIVEINGSWTALKDKAASSSPIKFATIDEEFRPESEVYVRQQGRGMNTYLLLIEPTGNVYWSKYGTSSSSNITANNKYICHALWTVNGGAVGGGGSTGTGGSNVDLSNYYTKNETDNLLTDKLNINLGVANRNVVTDENGNVSLEEKSGNNGFGSFYVNDEGHLIAVIPSNVNPYRLGDDGHLYYNTGV